MLQVSQLFLSPSDCICRRNCFSLNFSVGPTILCRSGMFIFLIKAFQCVFAVWSFDCFWPTEQGIVRVEAPRWLNFAQIAKMLKFAKFDEI